MCIRFRFRYRILPYHISIDAWFSFTVLNGQVALRVNVENRSMEQNDIERLVQVIRRAADTILAS